MVQTWHDIQIINHSSPGLNISISDHQSIMVSTIEKNSTKIKTKLPEKRSISIVETINAIEENVKWPEICKKILE